MNPIPAASPARSPMGQFSRAGSEPGIEAKEGTTGRKTFQKFLRKDKKPLYQIILSFISKLFKKCCGCCYCCFCSYRCMNVTLTLISILTTSIFFGGFVTILMLLQNENRISDIRTLSTSNLILMIKNQMDLHEVFSSAITSNFYGSLERASSFNDFNITTQVLYQALRSVEQTTAKDPYFYIYIGKVDGQVNTLEKIRNEETGENEFYWYYEWEGLTEKQQAVTVQIENPVNSETLKTFDDTLSLSDREGGSNVPWIQNVIKYPKMHWTNMYTSSEDPKIIFLTLTQPIFSEFSNETNPDVVGYVAIDQNLFRWTDYITEIPVSRGFSAHIVETPTRKIIATTEGRRAIPVEFDADGIPTTYDVTTAHSNIIQSSAKWVNFFFGDFSNLQDSKEFRTIYFDWYLMPHYLSFYRIIRPSGYDWTIFVDQPVILLNLELFLFIPASIIFLLVILVIVTVLFCMFSCGMSLDMNLIIRQAKKVQVLDLENKIFRRPKSLFSEMRQLQIIFAKMIETLKEMKPFVPPYLIAKIQNEATLKNAPEKANINVAASLAHSKSNQVLPINPSLDGTNRMSKASLGSGKTGNTANTKGSSAAKKFSMLSSGFEQKKATIVCISLANFSSKLSIDTFPDIEQMHSAVLTMVQTTVLATKGFMVKTDLFGFTFMFQSPSQMRDAMACICSIKEKVRDYNNKNKDKSMNVYIHCGVSQSYCFLGNIGNKTFLQFTVVGDAVEEAENLAHGAQNLFSTEENVIIVTEFIAHETDSSYLYRSLGTWKIRKISSLTEDNNAFAEDAQPIGADAAIVTEFYVFKLEEEKKDGSDMEWMYALELEKKVKAYQQMDACFEHVFRGDFSVADGIFKLIEFTDEIDPKKDSVCLFLKRMMDMRRTYPLLSCWGWAEINDAPEKKQVPLTNPINMSMLSPVYSPSVNYEPFKRAKSMSPLPNSLGNPLFIASPKNPQLLSPGHGSQPQARSPGHSPANTGGNGNMFFKIPSQDNIPTMQLPRKMN